MKKMMRAPLSVLMISLSVGFSQNVCADGPVRYDDHKLVTLNLETQREFLTVIAIGAKATACRVGPGKGQYVVSPEQLQAIRQAGMEPFVEVENFQALLDLERALNEQARLTLGDKEWFAVYRTWPEVNEYIDELITLQPDLAEKFIVGQSYEGRNIYGIRITGPGENKPAVLFNGCQHAREWIAVMVPMYIADQLIRQYDEDPKIQQLVDQVEFFIVPIVNPDGYEYTYAEEGDRMWRKNRAPTPGTDCIGTDLNRNWDADWNGGHSTSTNPCDFQIYVGSEPMSEPETQAMAQLIQGNPQIVAHIDYHNYSELILQPLGFELNELPEEDEIDALGYDMRQAILNVHGKDYPNGKPGELLYFASGIMPDWLYLNSGVFAYTIELRPKSFWDGGFLLPADQIIPTAEENFPAAMLMAERAADGVEFSFPAGLPEKVETDEPFVLLIEINSVMSGPVDPASAEIAVRSDPNAPFTHFAMTYFGGAEYAAVLPASECGETLEYFVQIGTTNGPIYRSPTDATDSVHTVNVVAFDGEGNVVDCPERACPADLTGDGLVDVFDLIALINAWGPCDDCPEDLTGDGVVDVFDLIELINAWGACPEG